MRNSAGVEDLLKRLAWSRAFLAFSDILTYY
jgi:hypothetical protein